MSSPANIILLGFMGSGKTSTGRELARLVDYAFLDTDEWIEKRNGTTIPEIFRERGEAFFRGQEAEALGSLAGIERHVVSTGGGIWMDEGNRRKLAGLGRCLWLKVSARTALQRVGANLSQRPLLAGSPDPERTMRELIEQREPRYSLADASFDSDGKTPKEVALEIQRWLQADLKH